MINTRYNLLEGDSFVTLAYIGNLTQGFSVLQDTFAFALQENIRARLTNTIFGYLPAPVDAASTKQIIGSNGYFLKLTTTNHGVDFIWHDTFNHLFYFWGPTKRAVSRAMTAIQYRINKCTAANANANASANANANPNAYPRNDDVIDENEDYSDMPDLVDDAGNIVQ